MQSSTTQPGFCVALAILMLLGADSLQLCAAPANDDFAQRAALSGIAATASVSNSGASVEPSEPAHAGDAGGLSLWWEWTAPSDGLLSVSTAGSVTEFSAPMDTVLAIYTGSQLESLAPVAANDQDATGFGTSRIVTFVASGSTYQIAVDSSAFAGPQTGTVQLSLSLDTSGANDHLANRKPLSGTHGALLWTNRGATREPGEGTHGGPGGSSVWWEWTAPFSGPITFTTEAADFRTPEAGSLDTLMAIYEGDGSSHASLTQLVSDDNTGSNLASLIVLNAEAGKRYFLAIEGKDGAVGEFHFCYSRGLPAHIDSIERLDDGRARLTITTDVTCRLRIEANSDLNNPAGWARVPNGRLNEANGTFQFTDSFAIGKDVLFYRIGSP